MEKRFTEEQIIGFLREADRGMNVSDARRLKALEAVCAAQESAGRDDARERGDEGDASKQMVTAPAKRELVRWMVTLGLSERRCLGVVGMNASALRYEQRSDWNVALRTRIVALAQRHHGTGWG